MAAWTDHRRDQVKACFLLFFCHARAHVRLCRRALSGKLLQKTANANDKAKLRPRAGLVPPGETLPTATRPFGPRNIFRPRMLRTRNRIVVVATVAVTTAASLYVSQEVIAVQHGRPRAMACQGRTLAASSRPLFPIKLRLFFFSQTARG